VAIANLKPNERYAFIGKTRSGKTSLAMVLGGTFAMSLPAPWEVWWLDTKNDPADIRKLREWGFRNAASTSDRTETGGLPNAVYYLIKPVKGEDDSVVKQSQQIIERAYERHHVLLIIDEYAQVIVSKQSAGQALLNVFQRGGGLNVGLIGLTQEPVFIPRQLISQSTHLVLFNLSYPRDIDYVRQFNKGYVQPGKVGYPYGFYWSWTDGPSGDFSFYENQRAWYNDLMVAQPRTPVQPA
jgi:hypothetical protein